MWTLLLALLACQPNPADTAAADSDSDVSEVARGPIQFGFPLPERDMVTARIGVDHDPTNNGGGFGGAACVDYEGRSFPNCYDQHDGSDYMLKGGFDTMDAGSIDIVAAADGVVIAVESEQYDRCHIDFAEFDVTCDGHPMSANYVILEHEGGIRSWYWHMKTGSPTVEVGQEVGCGEVIGKVGSSGNSSGPHLHFQIMDDEGNAVDPYAGPESQPETWWSDQGELTEFPGPGCTQP